MGNRISKSQFEQYVQDKSWSQYQNLDLDGDGDISSMEINCIVNDEIPEFDKLNLRICYPPEHYKKHFQNSSLALEFFETLGQAAKNNPDLQKPMALVIQDLAKLSIYAKAFAKLKILEQSLQMFVEPLHTTLYVPTAMYKHQDVHDSLNRINAKLGLTPDDPRYLFCSPNLDLIATGLNKYYLPDMIAEGKTHPTLDHKQPLTFMGMKRVSGMYWPNSVSQPWPFDRHHEADQHVYLDLKGYHKDKDGFLHHELSHALFFHHIYKTQGAIQTGLAWWHRTWIPEGMAEWTAESGVSTLLRELPEKSLQSYLDSKLNDPSVISGQFNYWRGYIGFKSLERNLGTDVVTAVIRGLMADQSFDTALSKATGGEWDETKFLEIEQEWAEEIYHLIFYHHYDDNEDVKYVAEKYTDLHTKIETAKTRHEKFVIEKSFFLDKPELQERMAKVATAYPGTPWASRYVDDYYDEFKASEEDFEINPAYEHLKTDEAYYEAREGLIAYGEMLNEEMRLIPYHKPLEIAPEFLKGYFGIWAKEKIRQIDQEPNVTKRQIIFDQLMTEVADLTRMGASADDVSYEGLSGLDADMVMVAHAISFGRPWHGFKRLYGATPALTHEDIMDSLSYLTTNGLLDDIAALELFSIHFAQQNVDGYQEPQQSSFFIDDGYLAVTLYNIAIANSEQSLPFAEVIHQQIFGNSEKPHSRFLNGQNSLFLMAVMVGFEASGDPDKMVEAQLVSDQILRLCRGQLRYRRRLKDSQSQESEKDQAYKKAYEDYNNRIAKMVESKINAIMTDDELTGAQKSAIIQDKKTFNGYIRRHFPKIEELIINSMLNPVRESLAQGDVDQAAIEFGNFLNENKLDRRTLPKAEYYDLYWQIVDSGKYQISFRNYPPAQKMILNSLGFKGPNYSIDNDMVGRGFRGRIISPTSKFNRQTRRLSLYVCLSQLGFLQKRDYPAIIQHLDLYLDRSNPLDAVLYFWAYKKYIQSVKTSEEKRDIYLQLIPKLKQIERTADTNELTAALDPFSEFYLKKLNEQDLKRVVDAYKRYAAKNYRPGDYDNYWYIKKHSETLSSFTSN